MSWIVAIGMAVAALAVFALLFRVSNGALTTLATALLLGLAGYALQARPGMPGAPKQADNPELKDGENLVTARKSFGGKDPPVRFQIIADGLTRQGQFANAAGILRGAVRDDPRDAEAWLAMANALVAHAEGNATPASDYAYARALSADPDYAAPPFFMGVMKVREGDLAGARALWRQALVRTPADAPWRPELERRVVTIEAVLAQIEAEEQAVLQRNRDGAKRASPPDSMSGDNDNDRRGAISR
ncbi:MAG: tetratricopeptide repeat protein [Novosphingobium sp.]|nr:tetratricopeptide repeat protein [Novosphingobium sp.]MCP5388742.1 tetratricopeptide repeat protein [Novosphingobium sp.]